MRTAGSARRRGGRTGATLVEARPEQVGHAAARRRVVDGDAGRLRAGEVMSVLAEPGGRDGVGTGGLEDAVEQAQVEQPVDRAVLLRAGREAVLDERLERVGVRVDRERDVLERAVDDLVGQRLAGLRLDRAR